MEKQKLKPTVVYILSIVGLLCCCFGGLGILLSGPAYYVAQNGLNKAKENPEDYDQESVKGMNNAKIVALITTIICGIYLIYNIYDLSTGGWEDRQSHIDEFMKGFSDGYNGAE